ncbi:MAG: hypothetical protein RLO52_26745 [Sandaracinaceae bacterium]
MRHLGIALLSLASALLALSPAAPASGLIQPFEQGPVQHSSPPPTLPPGRAPVREVRQALRAMQAEVQTCAVRFAPREGPRRRRLRVRVWLYPNGRWTMEVPEAAARRGATPRPRSRGLEVCIQSSLRTRIQPVMRPFAGRTRRKIEHAFVVRMPGPPPSEAALAQRLQRERGRLLQCVPGQGSGERAELVVRATLQGDGSFALTGVGLPEGAPFEAVVRCMEGELRSVRHDPVLTPRSFEATIPMRWSAPSAGGDEVSPLP